MACVESRAASLHSRPCAVSRPYTTRACRVVCVRVCAVHERARSNRRTDIGEPFVYSLRLLCAFWPQSVVHSERQHLDAPLLGPTDGRREGKRGRSELRYGSHHQRHGPLEEEGGGSTGASGGTGPCCQDHRTRRWLQGKKKGLN